MDRDYEGPISIIYGRLQTKTMSFVDTLGFLLNYKRWLESWNEAIDTLLPSTNMVHQSKSSHLASDQNVPKGLKIGNNYTPSQGLMNFGLRSFSVPTFFPYMMLYHNFFNWLNGDRGYANRGRGPKIISYRYLCQLCRKLGHLVNRYWYRFDPNFQAST